MRLVNFRKDIALPPPNGNYSAPRKLGTLKSYPRQPPGRPGRQSWHVDRRRAQWRRGWSSIGRRLEGHGGEVTIHVRVPYCVVRPKGTTVWGLHGVYLSSPPPRVQCRYNKVSPYGDVTRLARRVLPPGELRCICAALQTTPREDRRPRPLLVWPFYTMCRRASNKAVN